ncbi:conserved Plasmodium protein, unknown function [Plasmodium sp. DRC-Itaito]|nr:conserved Plasmodium protein, unknown function [Plasmodium sp. DRC-Itaito]
MNRIFYFCLFTILFWLSLVSGENVKNKDGNEKNRKAILLALLKNSLVDNKDYNNSEELKYALEHIENSELYPKDSKKFDKFIDEFFSYYNIHVNFTDEEKRILHISGVFKEFYVDVDSLNKDEMKEYFKKNYEKGLSLINLIVHSNLIIQQFDHDIIDKKKVLEQNTNTNKTVEYIIDNLNDLIKFKNIHLNNNSTGDFIIKLYTNYVNYINPYQTNPLPNTPHYYEHKNDHTKEHYIYDEEIVNPNMDNINTHNEEDNVYVSTTKGNQTEETEKKENHENNNTINPKYMNYEKYYKKIFNTIFEQIDKLNKIIFEIKNKNNSEASENISESNSEKPELNNENNYSVKLSNSSPISANKGSLIFPYTYYNPYYMFRLTNNFKENDKDSKTENNINNNEDNHNDNMNIVLEKMHNILKDFNINENIMTNKMSAPLIMAIILNFLKYMVQNKFNLPIPSNGENKINKSNNKALLQQSNKDKPIHKKKEIRNKKIQTKVDVIDEKTKKKIANTIYVNVGQSGINGFFNFFDFREKSIDSNMCDLLHVMEDMKIFDIFQTVIFIQKFTENVCASYCMNITDVLELSHYDMIFYDKMVFHFSKDGMMIKTDKKYLFNLKEFENILNLLNINANTIALNCPCKFYSDVNYTYAEQYKMHLKGYLHKMNEFDYINNFSASHLLDELIIFQDKFNYIKMNGELPIDDPKKIYNSNNVHDTAYYHNSRYFPTKDMPRLEDNFYEHLKYPDINTIHIYYNASPVKLNEVNDLKSIIIDEIKSKIFYINSYRVGDQFFPTYSNLGKDDHDLEYSAKNIYNISNENDNNSFNNNNHVDNKKHKDNYNKHKDNNSRYTDNYNKNRDNYYRHKDSDKRNRDNYNRYKDNNYYYNNNDNNNYNERKRYIRKKTYDKLSYFNLPSLKSIYNNKIKGNSEEYSSDNVLSKQTEWFPLNKPQDHEAFYNLKKYHTNVYEPNEEEKENEQKLKDQIKIKSDILYKDIEENKNTEDVLLIETITINNETTSNTIENNKDSNKERENSNTEQNDNNNNDINNNNNNNNDINNNNNNNINNNNDNKDENMSENNNKSKVTGDSIENINEQTNGNQHPCTEYNARQRSINAKYLIFFFKNLHVWKTDLFCQNINYMNNYLNSIQYNKTLTFDICYQTNTVTIYFIDNVTYTVKVNLEYLVFLLEKISLIMFVEDLCSLFEIDKKRNYKNLTKFLENTERINTFVRNHMMLSNEQFVNKNKYAKELAGISTSNLFYPKKDIILRTTPYNNIILDEKDIYQTIFIYMDDMLTEKMVNDTWITPYAFVVYTKSKNDIQGNNIKIEQNKHITKYSRSAIDKYVHYEYKRISENLNHFFMDSNSNVPQYNGNYKEYTVIIYNDNPSMANIVLTTTINVFNISFLQSIMEMLLNIKANQQFFSYKGKFIPVNAFITLEHKINYIFFNYIPLENYLNNGDALDFRNPQIL